MSGLWLNIREQEMSKKYDWTWQVGPAIGTLPCDECDHPIEDEVFFTNGMRTLCIDCATMVLNAREDQQRDMGTMIHALRSIAAGNVDGETEQMFAARCMDEARAAL